MEIPEDFPYLLRNPASVAGDKFALLVAVRPTFYGIKVVQRVPNLDRQLGVIDRIIPSWSQGNYPLGPDEALQSTIERLKLDAALHGATHEAVELLNLVSPFTEKELKQVADKLKAKTAVTKTPAKKAAAPKAETSAKTKAPAEKKDRAPRAPAADLLNDKRKISATDKGKEKLKKGGDNGAVANLKLMVDSKTVGKAIEAGLMMGDINYAVKTGTVELA